MKGGGIAAGVVAAVAFVAVVVLWPRPTFLVATPLPIDPREEHADIDAGTVAEGQRLAAALTGHRGKVYFGDVDAIRARGVLRVLTRNNASGYFLYRGVERGFDFEIAERLAKEIGVRLEMVVAPTRRDLIPWLLEGRGDIIIAGLSTEVPRGDRVQFSIPYQESRWVVVAPTRGSASKIDSVDDLGQVSLLVRPSSSALARLRALQVPGGLTLVAAVESFESEDLLDEVKVRENTAAVVEERVARLELLHRRDLQIVVTLDDVDLAGMAMRKEDVSLALVVDEFVGKNVRGTEWNLLNRRYHENKSTTAVAVDARRQAEKGNLTPYDDLFHAAAGNVGVKSPTSADGAVDDESVPLDWRLLAAVAVQESKLDPQAQSSFGARGLMQMLPSTAAENGCDDPFEPACAVRAAARYLGRMAREQSKPWPTVVEAVDGGGFIVAGAIDPDRTVALKDRVRFALAAYNAGQGHVDDARELAAREGLDPDRWFGHVEQAMLLLEKPRYYTTTRHGFARGSETVAYVSEIQSRFDTYVALTR